MSPKQNDNVTAPIPYTKKIALDDIEKITLTNTVNGIKKKKDVFQATSSDPELVLSVIHEFEDVSKPSRLNLSTGHLKFENFRECLAGEVRADWDLKQEGQPETNAAFADTLKEFITVFLDEEALTEQKIYMAQAKKPYKMSVKEFGSRLKWIVLLMKYFPGAPDGVSVYTELELKNIFKQAMPQAWQATYDKSGLTLNNTSWPALERYFKKLRAEDNSKNDDVSSADDGQTASSTQMNQNGKRGFGNRKNNKSDKRRNGQVDDEDDSYTCLFHTDGHKWRDCFGNPKSKNYKPNFRLPLPKHLNFFDQGQRRNGNTKNGGNKSTVNTDAHAVESQQQHTDVHFLQDFGAED